MEITEIIKDSLKYPIKNAMALVVYIVLVLFTSVCALISIYTSRYHFVIASSIISIISLVITLIINGYEFQIITLGIDKSDNPPHLDPRRNIIEGVMLMIVRIVYYIIPVVITLIVAKITGVFDAFAKIMYFVVNSSANGGFLSNSTSIISSIPPELLNNLVGPLAITAAVGLLAFIIFEFVETIGECRLAKTGNLGHALDVVGAFKDIPKIGTGKLIAVVILVLVISIAISGLFGLLSYYVPALGILSLIVNPYVLFFSNRAVGLLYCDV